MTTPRSGRQEPTTSFVLPYRQTDGDTAIDLYELTGRTALPWQKNLIYDILGRNEDGLWTHLQFGYEVPRQNGKGEILMMRELYGLAVGERILHTAHLVSTAHKAWERLCGVLDKLEIPYYSIKAKGQEIIDLEDGGRVEFRTRTARGGLGESYDLLIIDEAQEYQTTHESVLKYTIRASENPQTILCGTPPTPISAGTVFRDFRKDVLQGKLKNAGWAEWSVEEMSDPNDKDLWYLTNPSLGLTGLDERTIQSEIGTSQEKIIDFNIQGLGLWIKYNQQSAILKSEWEALRIKRLPAFKGKMNVGIKYNRNGETVSLAVGLKTGSGKIFVEVVDNRPIRDGNDWIIEFLTKTAKSRNKVVIDGAGAQQVLADEMKKERLKGEILPKVAEVRKANAAFEKMVFEQTLCHMGQPMLTEIASNCEKRAIGSNGGFGYKEIRAGDDISILDAVILAAWAATEFPEPKKQKIRY